MILGLWTSQWFPGQRGSSRLTDWTWSSLINLGNKLSQICQIGEAMMKYYTVGRLATKSFEVSHRLHWGIAIRPFTPGATSVWRGICLLSQVGPTLTPYLLDISWSSEIVEIHLWSFCWTPDQHSATQHLLTPRVVGQWCRSPSHWFVE